MPVVIVERLHPIIIIDTIDDLSLQHSETKWIRPADTSLTRRSATRSLSDSNTCRKSSTFRNGTIQVSYRRQSDKTSTTESIECSLIRQHKTVTLSKSTSPKAIHIQCIMTIKLQCSTMECIIRTTSCRHQHFIYSHLVSLP